MKIAVITSPFCELPPDAIGAVEWLWFNICDEFALRCHEVQLIGKRGKTILPSSSRLTRTYIPGHHRTGSIYGDIVLDLFFTVRALLTVEKCDVLVCNTFWSPLIAPLLVRRKYRTLVYNVARFPKKHLRYYKRVGLFACTSSSVKKALLAIAPNLKSQRIEVVSNPIDSSVFNTGMSLAEGRNTIVGYHGRIHPEKGLDLLAKAVAIVAERYVSIRIRMIGSWDVGKGGGGELYKRRLDELSGHRIDWEGPVADRKKLADLLRRCTVYCYPSVAENGETFGVSPLEAMGLGLPVIVSRLECFEDFIEDGKSGVVFDHRAGEPVGELVKKLLLCLGNRDFRKMLSANAAEQAKRFSTANIAQDYIRQFNESLAEKGSK